MGESLLVQGNEVGELPAAVIAAFRVESSRLKAIITLFIC